MMEFRNWSPAAPDAGKAPPAREELLVTFDHARSKRVLILPALFDEANKLRRFTLSVMRALDSLGIDSALPDWPGCHESLAPLRVQTLAGWREHAGQVARQFGATHTLAIRAGALIAPADLPGWRYAALGGSKLLSGLLRAQVIAEREAGRSATREALLEQGRASGLTLGGWELGPVMVRELESAAPASGPSPVDIDQAQLGGPGLWLRAEPGEDADQAQALARIIADKGGAGEDDAS